MTKEKGNNSSHKASKAQRDSKSKVEEQVNGLPRNPPRPARAHSSNAPKKPVLLYLPGSGGTVSIDHAKLLDRLRDAYDVHALEKPVGGGGLWAVAKVAADRNIKAVTDLVLQVTTPGEKWFLMASSFGNRVAAELLSPDGKHLPQGNGPAAFVGLGIPLYADSKSRGVSERTDHFARCFPAQIRVLLVSGAKDSCLTSKAPADGPKGEALLQAQSQRWACKERTLFHMVPGGGHGVLDGSAKPAAVEAAEDAIRAFLVEQE